MPKQLHAQRALLNATDKNSGGWTAEYISALATPRADSATALDLLLEHTHGPHGTAWWVNGIQFKLGFVGKVIGFSIPALSIGNLESFDALQSEGLLRGLTTALGVALLTTMVGLVGNILPGLQLTRLDRYLTGGTRTLELQSWKCSLGSAVKGKVSFPQIRLPRCSHQPG